jgi:DNA invertase Pin-like site-specific DNA recombinase
LRAIGYVRVSTDDQADSGAGLEAQRRAIRHEALRRGWQLVEIVEDAASGKSLARRPGLQEALKAVEGSRADTLVVAKLDRLSRSLLDFSALMEQSRKGGWTFVALDLGVDTTTPAGEMMANVLAVFAHFERRLIGQRTKDALAVKKSEGVQLGRPRRLPESVRMRIRDLREQGRSFASIAGELNSDGVPTAQGGRAWYPSTVRAAQLTT